MKRPLHKNIYLYGPYLFLCDAIDFVVRAVLYILCWPFRAKFTFFELTVFGWWFFQNKNQFWQWSTLGVIVGTTIVSYIGEKIAAAIWGD